MPNVGQRPAGKGQPAAKQTLGQCCCGHLSFIAHRASWSVWVRINHFVFFHRQTGDNHISRFHQGVVRLKMMTIATTLLLQPNLPLIPQPTKHSAAYRAFLRAVTNLLRTLLMNALPIGSIPNHRFKIRGLHHLVQRGLIFFTS